jgi:hypothetical protein
MTTEPIISLECQRGYHRERCLSQEKCSCKCHDPLRPPVDLDEEARRGVERHEEYETTVPGGV